MTEQISSGRNIDKKKILNQAKIYLRENRLYKSNIEKKALKIARTARKKEWKESLKTMSDSERKYQKKAFRYFKKRIHFKRNIIITAAAFCLALIAVVVVM